jgi:mRNA-degrading endonuclease RelE of RelBE toxin-antitoxin system
MRLQWHPEAIQEFLKLETKIQEYLNKQIEKLPEKGVKWEKVDLVKRKKNRTGCL